MAHKSDFLENKLLDHVLRNVSYTPPTTVYAALYTTAPTDAGGGTEVSGTGYARKAITFGAASGGATENSAIVDFGTAGSNWGTVVACGIFDAVSGGNLLYWNNLVSNKTINSGDTSSFPIGTLDVTED